MRRHIKIGLVVITLGFGISVGFFVDVVGRIRTMVNEHESAENPFKAPPPPLYKPTDPPLPVKLFFPSESGNNLIEAEDSSIFKSTELTNRAHQILQKLLDGPTLAGLDTPFPKDTKLEDLFWSEKGTLFVDFSDDISTNHPGGILNEQATIYSIVDSLTYNLPEIKDVKILIGGIEKETLAGHCLLLLPLQLDLSLTNVAAPEEHAVTQKQ